MNELVKLVLSLSLGGSLMAVLILGIKLTMGKKLPSAFYYYALILVLLRLLVPVPGFMKLDRVENAATAVQPTVSTSERVYRTTLPVAANPQYSDFDGQSTESQGIADVSFTESEAVQTTEIAEQEKSAEGRASLALRVLELGGAAMSYIQALVRSGEIWLAAWGIGAAATMIWYVAGYRRFYRALKRTLIPADLFERTVFRKLGGSRRLRLCCSGGVSTPMLIGLIHPILVLPDKIYSEEMLRDILRHELTHYKRRDLIFKWLAVFATAIHWFNPIVHIVRRELDRACEMSCDERLLRSMDRNAKRSYGETLLYMAADNSLPKRLVATTFATEKRNLKERLEQIMTYKHMGRATLALMLIAAMLLVGCATAVDPQSSNENETAPTPTPAVNAEAANSCTVSTVDELLAAIAPDTGIILNPGTYNLADASDYGEASSSEYYSWEECFDGYQLVIKNADNLMLFGTAGEVTISAEPRFAYVLSFERSKDIVLSGLIIGHTEAPGECTGGVVALNGIDTAMISQCSMFGCGTVGITAYDSTDIKVLDSEIYDCSYSIAELNACSTVLFDGCSFHDNENYTDSFILRTCDNVGIINSEIQNNYTRDNLISSSYSSNVYFAGNKVQGNTADGGMLYLENTPITIEKCSFEDNGGVWYGQPQKSVGNASVQAVDAEGRQLDDEDFLAMEWSAVDGWTPAAAVAEDVELSQGSDGYIHVSTVDEFLAAIASDTTIYLEDGVYDLSTATGYGGFGGEHYTWQDTMVDGPQLVISGVSNLTIIGGGIDKASVQAMPRYAEVLAFDRCTGISLKSFTAGHTQEPGDCVGGVIYFSESSNISIEGCSLYGCGVWGITAIDSSNMKVTGTEIYECSMGDLNLSSSENLVFENCNFHDNGLTRVVNDCTNATLDGVELVGIYPPSHSDLKVVPVEGDVYTGDKTLFICYKTMPVTELTLPMDTAIEIVGKYYGSNVSSADDPEIKWTVSGDGKNQVTLSERKHGAVIIENTGAKASTVTLTAECGNDKVSVVINLVET